jgi:GNAT superfamily N-acetyltransferase
LETIIPFSELYVVTQSPSRTFALCMDGDGVIADYVDTYIVPCGLEIYGCQSSDESDKGRDEMYERVYSGDYSDLIKIGGMHGRLILYEQMQNDGYDPYMVCDDSDADLEYVMATLQEDGAPLGEDSLDWYRNILHIDELEIFEEHRGKGFGSRVLNALPDLILQFYHVKPDLMTYYPAPLDGEWISEAQKEEDSRIARILLERAFERVIPEEIKKDYDVEKNDAIGVLQFPDIYCATEDDLSKAFGRKNSNSIYPHHLKNMRLIQFYEKNGFQEAGDNRLWWKSVDDKDE